MASRRVLPAAALRLGRGPGRGGAGLALAGTLAPADLPARVLVPFDLPAGLSRLTLRWSLAAGRGSVVLPALCGPAGPRGTLFRPEVEIEACRATPGLLPGTIEPGRWHLALEVFHIAAPTSWRVEVETCTTPLPERPAPAPRRTRPRGPGWYRGDLHSHSDHSDGSWSLADLVTWARSRELDFLALTDHNTVSGHAELHSLASDDLLTLGGMELTTPRGHALIHGAGRDWFGPLDGAFTIAHPMAPRDDFGRRWERDDLMPGPARQVEVWSGGPWSVANEAALALFRRWLGQGHRLVATAGSDIHGQEGGLRPTGFNHVEAESLTEPAILAAVAAGRNYLSSGPRLILTAGGVAMGGKVPPGAEFQIAWQTGPVALSLHLVDAGGPAACHPLPPDARGMIRHSGRAEVFLMAELRDRAGVVHALTNPIFTGDGSASFRRSCGPGGETGGGGG